MSQRPNQPSAPPTPTPAAQPAPAPRVEFFRHGLGPAERSAVQRVLRSLFLTTGPEVASLEREFAAYAGTAEAVAVSSCTAALHLTLVALGIGPGDEVITTPQTFVATANAIVYTGATPVFADVEPATGNLEVDAVRAALTVRTRAILPVHLYGQMVDLHALQNLAKAHGLALVEDAAHCLEGQRDGLRPGQISQAACFSFYATKNITCGEGGLIATQDSALAARLRRLRNHGIDRDAASRYVSGPAHWDQMELGFKAGMADIQAALLRPQLQRVERLWQKRARRAQFYDRNIATIEGVSTLPAATNGRNALHLYPIRVAAERRDAIMAGLHQHGIGVGVHYRPVHLMSFYRRRFATHAGQLPVAEQIGAQTLSLPLYPRLTADQQKRVIAALRAVLAAS